MMRLKLIRRSILASALCAVAGHFLALKAAETAQPAEGVFTTSPLENPGLVTYPPPQLNAAPTIANGPYEMAEETLNTFQFVDTDFHLRLGPSAILVDGRHDNGSELGLRYQLSPSPWDPSTEFPWHIGSFPLDLSLEVGAILPHGTSVLKQETRSVSAGNGASTSFQAEEHLPYEAHLGLVDALPHGRQTIVYPEIGFGGSLGGVQTKASAITSAANGSFLGYSQVDQTNDLLSPWVMLGLHFFPTRFYSATLGASLFHYGNSLDLQGQKFNTSLTGWSIVPTLQIQIVWPSRVHVALTPKRLPPWLIPAYTTEPISPWVAAPEVAQDPRWSKTGEPIGNVLFQYKSRYVDKVELIGDFNDWEPEEMIKDRGGYWVMVKDLPPGRHLYNYVINGKREIKDPWNKQYDPDNRIRGSSIAIVPGPTK